MAKTPKRPGWSLISRFAHSFVSRAIRPASEAGRKPTCGVVGYVMSVAMPALSMSSIERCGVQFDIGGLSSFAFLRAQTSSGQRYDDGRQYDAARSALAHP